MITRIQVQGFKSLQSVDLNLGNLNLFVGTNASGKSNFFDALRVLQGIAYGFTIDEILNGKPKSATSDVWEQIRGGSEKADFILRGGEGTLPSEKVIELGVSLPVQSPLTAALDARKLPIEFTTGRYLGPPPVKYSIGISAKEGCVRREHLSVGDQLIFDSADLNNTSQSPVIKVRYNAGWSSHWQDKRVFGDEYKLEFAKSRPVLHQLAAHENCSDTDRMLIQWCLKELSNTQRIDPSPAILRDYSRAHIVKRMGDRGENFAGLIGAIQSDEKTKAAYLSWLKQLTPTELDDVTVLKGALGEPLFAIKEKGMDFPAPILSDGTLRFAAITAAFFQPDMPELLTIEEIENGIHPSRLRLLVELLRSQASRSTQVMATTHSPVVLAWLTPDDYRSTFLCSRDSETGASKIVPLSEVPNLVKIVGKQSLGDLFAEGWLEEAS